MENIPSLTPGAHNHGTLAWHMLKKLASVRCSYAEGFYIRSLLTDICDHANLWDQRIQLYSFYDRYIRSLLFTSMLFKSLDHLHDIQG